jgi:hypothetical protein
VVIQDLTLPRCPSGSFARRPSGSCARPSVRPRFFPEPPRHEALLAPGIQVGQQHGQCLADDAAAIHSNAESPEAEPGPFQVEQLAAGQVNGDLLGVTLPAAGLALGFDGRTPADRAEQLGDSGQAYPP